MCGIVGLFLKDKSLEPQLGALTAEMLGTMCDRGPDSAGFAIYGSPTNGQAKLTLQSP
ncbi:MAG: glutamine amidotransferase, partial [Hyphomicrobiaceae bacterium]|nr:glutamine amidotransferase [Hyphomicrobiaceae bacterium]MDO9384942.1 glutamine amidotransferase [Hyphomicrobiaceae bacterium]